MHADIQTYRHTSTEIQGYRDTDIHTHTKTDRQADRMHPWAGGWRHEWTDDIQAYMHTYRHTHVMCRHRCIDAYMHRQTAFRTETKSSEASRKNPVEHGDRGYYVHKGKPGKPSTTRHSNDQYGGFRYQYGGFRFEGL